MLQHCKLPHDTVLRSTKILFQTHKWAPNIAAAATNFQLSALEQGHDFSVLCCTNKPVEIPNHFSPIFVSEDDVRQFYKNGFHSAWASNHWVLMYYWCHLGKFLGHTYIWSIEYDVRAYGNLGLLWGPESPYVNEDYIASEPIHKVRKSYYWVKHMDRTWRNGPNWPCMSAYKQIFRVSNRFLSYLHDQFLLGNNGQDEMSLANHAIEGQFTVSSLQPFLHSTWSPYPKDVQEAERAFRAKFGSPQNGLLLFHPVKNI